MTRMGLLARARTRSRSVVGGKEASFLFSSCARPNPPIPSPLYEPATHFSAHACVCSVHVQQLLLLLLIFQVPCHTNPCRSVNRETLSCPLSPSSLQLLIREWQVQLRKQRQVREYKLKTMRFEQCFSLLLNIKDFEIVTRQKRLQLFAIHQYQIQHINISKTVKFRKDCSYTDGDMNF